MKFSLTKALGFGTIFLSSFLPFKEAKAQISGDLELNISKDPLIETNFFYGNDSIINGFTFLDYNFKDKGFFGITYLSKDLGKSFKVESQIFHENEPFTKGGLGMYYKVPFNPEKITAEVGLLPLWVSKKEGIMKNRLDARYLVFVNLPKDFSFLAFGQANLGAKGGPQWNYGEFDISKKFGKTKKWGAGYNPSLTNKGKLAPRYNHRFAVRRKF